MINTTRTAVICKNSFDKLSLMFYSLSLIVFKTCLHKTDNLLKTMWTYLLHFNILLTEQNLVSIFENTVSNKTFNFGKYITVEQ